MIRAVAVVTLTLLLVFVLYVPSAHPPERFVAQLRSEHAAAAAYWGTVAAHHVLDRALRMQADAADASPIPNTRHAPTPVSPHQAVAAEMGHVNKRLFANPYFRSVDALLLLASYRLSMLLEWLPWMLPLALATVADGWLTRARRSKEFLHHNPELFALWCCLQIVGPGATTVALVLPVDLHPAVMACVPIGAAVVLGQAMAHFHRRA